MQGRALCVVLFWSVSLAGQQLVLQPIATGLTRPLGLVTAGDSRLFIVQQLGQILIYDGTRLLSTPFLDVSSLVTPNLSGESERGLLGLAFDPHYATNGFFFIYYTDRSGNITLARYSVSANRDRADPKSAAIVLTIDHTESAPATAARGAIHTTTPRICRSVSVSFCGSTSARCRIAFRRQIHS